MSIVAKNALLDNMNDGMAEVLKKLSKDVKITFLTTPKHIKISGENN